MRAGAGQEIEIKLRLADAASAKRQMRELRARHGRRVHEVNAVFDTPDATLRSKGQLLRVRVERPAAARGTGRDAQRRMAKSEDGIRRARARVEGLIFPRRGMQKALLTLKAPVASGAGDRFEGEREQRGGAVGYKVRREIEAAVGDAGRLRQILKYLGYEPVFYYEKFRTHYRLPGLERVMVTLDETPIGTFFELEGPAREIDRARRSLGYEAGDANRLSYGALYAEYQRARGLPFRHMVFA